MQSHQKTVGRNLESDVEGRWGEMQNAKHGIPVIADVVICHPLPKGNEKKKGGGMNSLEYMVSLGERNNIPEYHFPLVPSAELSAMILL